MGSILSQINDDYEEYEYVCDLLNIRPHFLRGAKEGDTFYNHLKQLCNEHGVHTVDELIKKLKK